MFRNIRCSPHEPRMPHFLLRHATLFDVVGAASFCVVGVSPAKYFWGTNF